MLSPYGSQCNVDLDEHLHPGHHSIRLKGTDYAAPGLYFVTIRTSENRCVLADVKEGRVRLSRLGHIVCESWNAIPDHFASVNLDEFVIMPNHVHGLIEIAARVGAQHAAPQLAPRQKPGVTHGSLGAIIRSFKSAVTKRARAELTWTGEIWQRNYFERIVRDGREFSDTCRYIKENPLKWALDAENPEAKTFKVKAGNTGAQHAAPLQRKQT